MFEKPVSPDGSVVRELRRADLPSFLRVLRLGIGELERATGLDASAEGSFDQLSRWSIWFLYRLSLLVGRPFVEIFVVAKENDIRATGTLVWLPKAGYVAGIATDHPYRGRGYASRVLDAQVQRAARRQRGWLLLDVESENRAAISVYHKAGYREVGTVAWYRRAGVPPAGATASDGVHTASKNEFSVLSSRIDSVRPKDLRSAVPATARLLTHAELLAIGRGAEKATWVGGRGPEGSAVLRAYFLASYRIAMFFPVPAAPNVTADEYARLLNVGGEWLRSRAPTNCVAAVFEPTAALDSALTAAGFARVVSSTAMVRPIGS